MLVLSAPRTMQALRSASRRSPSFFSASAATSRYLISWATRMPASFKAAARALTRSSTRGSLAVSIRRTAPPSSASLAFLALLTAAGDRAPRAELANGSGKTWRIRGPGRSLRDSSPARASSRRADARHHDDQVPRSLASDTALASSGSAGSAGSTTSARGLRSMALRTSSACGPGVCFSPDDRDLEPDLVRSRPASWRCPSPLGVGLAPRADDELEGPGSRGRRARHARAATVTRPWPASSPGRGHGRPGHSAGRDGDERFRAASSAEQTGRQHRPEAPASTRPARIVPPPCRHRNPRTIETSHRRLCWNDR